MLAEVRPDVFWQPNNLQPIRARGVRRVIVTMHDVFGLGWCWRYWLWHIYYHLNFRRTLRNVTEIWFNSRETEGHVRAGAARRLKQITTKVVYPLTVVPDRTTIRPYVHDRPYFLYLGNVEMRKGADILTAAFAQYRVAGGKADLLFAGPAKNVDVPQMEGIQMLGYVDDETKFSLMCSSVALVVPSRAEGYGMQVAEAAALGVRCLASDLSVFCEIDARNRRLFPVGDVPALARLMMEESRLENCR